MNPQNLIFFRNNPNIYFASHIIIKLIILNNVIYFGCSNHFTHSQVTSDLFLHVAKSKNCEIITQIFKVTA